MSFDRGLNSIQVKPYPKGYVAPTTEAVNTHLPVFDLADSDYVPEENLLPTLPDVVRLRAQLQPIPITDKTAHVVYERDGKALKSMPLYEVSDELGISSQLQAVQLVFSNLIEQEKDKQFCLLSLDNFDLVLEQENLIFVMNFVHQIDVKKLSATSIENEDALMITPPGAVNANPVWGYGGYYRDGCDLHQIEQILFTITRNPPNTGVHLSRSSRVKSGATFVDSSSVKNLGELIEAGAAQISLNYGVDEEGKGVGQSYRSYRAIQNNSEIDIYFKKG